MIVFIGYAVLERHVYTESNGRRHGVGVARVDAERKGRTADLGRIAGVVRPGGQVVDVHEHAQRFETDLLEDPVAETVTQLDVFQTQVTAVLDEVARIHHLRGAR